MSGIQSIEVGAKVLFALEQGRGPLALGEVARLAGLHPSKAHRYLVSLVRTGLASQDAASGLYDLGPASRHLGIEALRRTNPVNTAAAFAVELRDQTGHSVNVAVWGDGGPTIVRWDLGAHVLPMVVRVGSTLPLLDSAVGHVFLAHLPKSMTAEVIKAQRRDTGAKPLPAAEVRALVDGVHASGYGSTRNHMIIGLAALAAPVFGADGTLELVLGLAMPARLLTKPETKRLGPLLRGHADRVSRELGYARIAATS